MKKTTRHRKCGHILPMPKREKIQHVIALLLWFSQF